MQHWWWRQRQWCYRVHLAFFSSKPDSNMLILYLVYVRKPEAKTKWAAANLIFRFFLPPMLQRGGLSAAVIRYYYILMIGSRRGKLCQAVKIWAGDNLGCCCCSFRQFLTKWDFLPFEEALCCVWLQQQLVSHDPGLGQLMDQTEIEAGARSTPMSRCVSFPIH